MFVTNQSSNMLMKSTSQVKDKDARNGVSCTADYSACLDFPTTLIVVGVVFVTTTDAICRQHMCMVINTDVG